MIKLTEQIISNNYITEQISVDGKVDYIPGDIINITTTFCSCSWLLHNISHKILSSNQSNISILQLIRVPRGNENIRHAAHTPHPSAFARHKIMQWNMQYILWLQQNNYMCHVCIHCLFCSRQLTIGCHGKVGLKCLSLSN